MYDLIPVSLKAKHTMNTGYDNIKTDPRLGRFIPKDFDHVSKHPLLLGTAAAPAKPVPVVCGVNWYSAFDTPVQDADGRWWVGKDSKQLGSIRGGHCIAGDTIIHLLDGRNVPISELEGQKDIWVYGCLENSQPYPVKAQACIKTKFAKTLEIKTDKGASIRLTPEHLVMLRDGSYKAASELQIGDRLMPLRRQIHHRGYEQLSWYDGERKKEFTHRLFGLAFGCPENMVVHHDDENKKNNHPDNFRFKTASQHALDHAFWLKSPETYKPGWLSSESGRKYLNSLQREDLVGQVFGKLTVKCVDSVKNRNRIWLCKCECGNETKVITAKLKNGHTRSCGCLYRFRGRLEEIPTTENHSVLEIVEGKEEWVYDLINVSPTNNFAANGIFVHNCVCIPHKATKDTNRNYKYYNQGNEGACVGFGSSRAMTLLNRRLYNPWWLWNRAKEVDEFTETNPGDDNGTTVRAAFDVLRNQGHVRKWGKQVPNIEDGVLANVWARNIDDNFSVLQNEEYKKLGALPFVNSWGEDYPHVVWMPCETWQRLMNEDGEFTMITDR